nr:ABC transporter substrate-binding protein [Tessaracoccus coleopterorum]
MLYNVYETLLKLDNEGSIKPLLATEWSVTPTCSPTSSASNRRRNSPRGPVDADAVVASFERARSDKATETVRGKWAVVDTIVATDRDTVTVTLTRPSNQWLYDLTGPSGIVTDPTATADLNTTPAGSGPYKFVRWDQGSLVQLDANQDYWGTPARFSPVNFRYFADPNAMNTSMLSGQLDIISNLTVPQSLGQFSDTSKYTVHEGTTEGEVVLGFNHASEALKDLRVRRAINHAIDRQALMDSVWGGKGMLIGSMVPPTDPWFEDLSNTYPYDPAKAKELLAEAGYASGLTLRLRVPNLPYGPTSGRFIAAQLQAVGIKVELEELEWARWLDQVYGKHDYDMTVVAHVEPATWGPSRPRATTGTTTIPRSTSCWSRRMREQRRSRSPS